MKKHLNLNIFFFAALFAIASAGCNSGTESKETGDHITYDSESLYQLEGDWVTQNGDTIQLGELKGKIPVVAMVFTNCTFACPKIVDDIKTIKQEVPPEKKDKMVYVLISFDTERDTPERLKEFARSMQLDDKWLLLHGDENEVREMSMLLNVKYKKQPNGDFGHSNEITLLDTEGAIVTQVEGLGSNQQPIIDKIRDM